MTQEVTSMANEYYEEWLARKQREHGTKWDASDLAPQFVPYFHSDQRIRVESAHGYTRTGTVGVTTGWKPTFLLMPRSSAHGSSDVLGTSDRIVAVKVGRKYVAVEAGR